jgi:hypothetical protein
VKYKNRFWSRFSFEEVKDQDQTGLSSTIHIQYISTFYAKLVWWNNIPGVAEIYGMIFHFNSDRNFKQFWATSTT